MNMEAPSASATGRFHARAGTYDDIMAISVVFALCHDEGKYPAPNVEKATNALCDVIAKGVCIVICDDTGLVVATAGLLPDTWWFSDSAFLRDVWFLVHPDHRSLEVTGLLMRAAIAAARGTKLPLMIGMMTMVETERKLNVFGRYMRQIGATYFGG